MLITLHVSSLLSQLKSLLNLLLIETYQNAFFQPFDFLIVIRIVFVSQNIIMSRSIISIQFRL